MRGGGWRSYLSGPLSAETAAGFRLAIGAVSGAALSFSYTGLYLSIYSWFCVGVLLFALLGARPRVAFGCGFFPGLFFVLTSVPWIAPVLSVSGGPSVAGGSARRLLIALRLGY